MADFVVSFTSHGQRLVLVPKMLDTLREQTIKPPKIVMTLMPEDYSLLASLKCGHGRLTVTPLNGIPGIWMWKS